jgi:AraC-like DNA-binding protein
MSAVLTGYVDAMADWDLGCSDQPQLQAIVAAPNSSPLMLIQYRTPTFVTWHFGAHSFRRPECRHFATKLQTGVIVVQPRGPLGMIAVRLKARTAAGLLGDQMRRLLDTQIGLEALFGAGQVSLLERKLSEATTSAERFAWVESFLLANLRPYQAEPVSCQAAAMLARNHQLRVWQLARCLDTSQRHLSRNFRKIYGMGPKQFARIARVEEVLCARARGATWAEIAQATGFTDQAHMINDFTGIVGVPPGQLLRDNKRVIGFDNVSSRYPGTSECLWAGFGRRRNSLGTGE